MLHCSKKTSAKSFRCRQNLFVVCYYVTTFFLSLFPHTSESAAHKEIREYRISLQCRDQPSPINCATNVVLIITCIGPIIGCTSACATLSSLSSVKLTVCSFSFQLYTKGFWACALVSWSFCCLWLHFLFLIPFKSSQNSKFKFLLNSTIKFKRVLIVSFL